MPTLRKAGGTATPLHLPEARSAVDKALKLLFLVAEMGGDGSVRIGDLVKRAGMSRPTAHRHLNSLIAFRLVEQTCERGHYRLASGVLALGARMSNSLHLKERALPILRALGEATGLTVHLGVRDGNQLLYLEKIESKEPIRLASAVGQVSPLHTSGVGKSLLAYSGEDIIQRCLAAGLVSRQPNSITTERTLRLEIERIRSLGYAIDDEENEESVRCVGAPVFGHENSVVASISIAGTTSQISRRDVASLGPKVREYADRISHDLGYHGAR